MDDDVTLILAYGRNGVLGNRGALPWPAHREDMRRFREETLGSTIIMGRKTLESIGRPLPYRQNVVISRHPGQIRCEGSLLAVSSMKEAVAAAEGTRPIVIGGAAIYALAMPFARRILLTEMHGDFEGDVFFKIPFLHQWTEVSREEWRGADGDCTFLEYRLDE